MSAFFITIIALFVGLYQLILGCSEKKKNPIKTAEPIASPSAKPSSSISNSKETPKDIEEESPPILPDDSRRETKPFKIPYESLIPWLVSVLKNGVENEIKGYENKPDYVKKRRWFLAFDKNPTLNRYKEPKCYDFSKFRYYIDNKKKYINASMAISTVEGRRNSQWNILTQGPLSNTIPHFWEMICDIDAEFIVMLCSFIEKGVEQSAQYYPEKEGGVEKYEEFEVKHLKKEEDPVKGVTWTKLEVTDASGKSRTVNHIYVSWWPHKTAPEDPKLTIELYRWLEKSRDVKRRMVVHCDSGVGRSACFLGIDMLLKYEISYRDTSNGKIDACIRFFRNGAIDSPLLQVFLLACLIEFCYQEKQFGPELNANYKRFMEDYKNYSKKMSGAAANLKMEPPKKI